MHGEGIMSSLVAELSGRENTIVKLYLLYRQNYTRWDIWKLIYHFVIANYAWWLVK